MVMPFSLSREWPPSPPRRLPQARRRRVGRIAVLLAALPLSIWACTLVADDYQPDVVTDEALAPIGGEDAGMVQDAGGCGPGIECCQMVSCPVGQACRDGACGVIPSLSDDAGCSGSDCPGSMPVPLAPTCDDGERNGNETGLDCGGSCPIGCAVGADCSRDADCAAGLSCLTGTSQCAEPSCEDGIANGTELAEDCGGGCPGCPDGSPCNEGSDCESQVCGEDGTCAAAACGDEQQNGDETAIDCGGSCPDNCATGGGCEGNEDCQSGVCGEQGCAEGLERCCQAPACDDEVQNGGESDVDCGTFACGDCGVGDTCQTAGQCSTNLCSNGVCAPLPNCNDDVENGTETGVDCGGTCAANCPDGSGCNVAGDCQSNSCQNGTCISCGDGEQNGTETGVDCGGACAANCPDLAGCNVAADCQNNNCLDGTCISCGDGVQNGTETDVDCGGADPFCRRCGTGETCQSNTDCVNVFCLAGSC
jgi:hypothetical protein